MLAGLPWMVHAAMSRGFTFSRVGLASFPVRATLRGMRAAELVNSEVQADVLIQVDARPFTALGVHYLMKFDRFVSEHGESYVVQSSRPKFDGETLMFHACLCRGGT